MKLKRIETERLALRAFTEEDVPAYHSLIYADPAVMRYLPGGVPRPLEKAVEHLRLFIDSEAQYGFTLYAVTLRERGTLIGQCGLYPLSESGGQVEVAYAFGHEFWGAGYATEAARAVFRFGFEHCGLPRIYALAVPENLASRHVMEKLCMEYEGITTRYHAGAELAIYHLDRAAFKYGQGHYRVELY